MEVNSTGVPTRLEAGTVSGLSRRRRREHRNQQELRQLHQGEEQQRHQGEEQFQGLQLLGGGDGGELHNMKL